VPSHLEYRNPRRDVPLYGQIVEHVRTRIRSGVLPAGYRLPPTRSGGTPPAKELPFRPRKQRKQGAVIPRPETPPCPPRGRTNAAKWKYLCAFYDDRCLCCGEKKHLTKDHVYPRCYGGPNGFHNLQPLCAECNTAKGNQWWDYRDGRCPLEEAKSDG
jgi:hypothetical protein